MLGLSCYGGFRIFSYLSSVLLISLFFLCVIDVVQYQYCVLSTLYNIIWALLTFIQYQRNPISATPITNFIPYQLYTLSTLYITNLCMVNLLNLCAINFKIINFLHPGIKGQLQHSDSMLVCRLTGLVVDAAPGTRFIPNIFSNPGCRISTFILLYAL